MLSSSSRPQSDHRFTCSHLQDAHEFLNFLLNKIGEDLAADDRERRAAAKLANLSRPENSACLGRQYRCVRLYAD